MDAADLVILTPGLDAVPTHPYNYKDWQYPQSGSCAFDILLTVIAPFRSQMLLKGNRSQSFQSSGLEEAADEVAITSPQPSTLLSLILGLIAVDPTV
jgi:hypothetical protein